jgi:hypothetical protein
METHLSGFQPEFAGQCPVFFPPRDIRLQLFAEEAAGVAAEELVITIEDCSIVHSLL